MKGYLKFFLICFIGLSTIGSAYEFPSKVSELSIFDKYDSYLIEESVEYTDFGIVFPEGKPIHERSIEDFLNFCQAAGHIPTRDELIIKMMGHKQEYNIHLAESKKILVQLGMMNNDLRDLYKAAEVSVCTYVGGVNFIRCFVIAILDYALNKGFDLLSMWREWKTHMYECDHHATMFDFYMGVLKQLYGQ